MTVSTDLFYDAREGIERKWVERGAKVVEMEAATLFRLAELRDFRAGCVLGVSDIIGSERSRIGHEELAEMGVRLGEVAFEALARAGSTAR
jgi:purine-nucleoside phosphorylase